MAADVVVLAASRTQRCEDDRYVLLARAVDGDELRGRLTELGTDRVGFLLHTLDHRELGPTPRSGVGAIRVGRVRRCVPPSPPCSSCSPV